MNFFYRVLLVFLLSIVGGLSSLAADIIQPGDLVVSGFSGKIEKAAQTFIKSDGESVKIFEAQGVGINNARVADPPVRFSAYAKDIGQVFGIALDNATPPNIYLTATAAYGLHIVTPDSNGDGIPEVARNGAADATFMEGQFGNGGGAGTVWKIDGKSGDISLFADLKYKDVPNGGAGLGNIVFDPLHYQLFVSDLDNGIIYQLDMNGNLIGTYDHGVDGRAAAGLPSVEDDGTIADIHSPAFDSLNSDTWGLTDIRRRVWGLGLFRGRLYYAVGEGPQIWSVGLKSDGSFANDARIEIKSVPGGFPVSDILFTNRGWMILAQRGGMLGDMKMLKFHEPAKNRVLRYRLDKNGTWVEPGDEYAIGFASPEDYQNTSGGVGLGCSRILWSTGDNLRNDPALADALKAGGELVIHGLQGNDVRMVRPLNVPPWSTVFIDYDKQYGDPEKAGYVGDVEVYLPCGEGVARGDEGYQYGSSTEGGSCCGWCTCVGGWCPPGEWTPPDDWTPPDWWPDTPDLHLIKSDSQCELLRDANGTPSDYNCTFTLVISNESNATYEGPLHVEDTPDENASYVAPPGGSIDWNCNQDPNPGGTVVCDSDGNVTLIPGQSETLELTFTMPSGNPERVHWGPAIRGETPNPPPPTQMEPWENCAVVNPSESNETNVTFPEEANTTNNSDCGWAYPPGPDLMIKKIAGPWGKTVCHSENNITVGKSILFAIVIENVGDADYTGPITFTDTLPEGSSITDIVIPPGLNIISMNCLQTGNSLSCTTEPESITLAPGEFGAIGIVITIPNESIEGDSIKNCVDLSFQEGVADSNSSGNNSSCATVEFGDEPGVDLSRSFNVCITCPEGWTREPDGWEPPEGWEVRYRGRIGEVICGRPKPKGVPIKRAPLVCPIGWTRYPSKAAVPKGWSSNEIKRGDKSIVCAKAVEHIKPNVIPVYPKCLKGENRFAKKSQIPPKWKWRKVTKGGHTIYCAKPLHIIHKLVCPSGWVRYPSRASVPKGWQSTTISSNGKSIVCARPQYVPIEKPQCNSGEERVAYRKVPYLRERGWSVHSVTKNGITIWCATPPVVKPHCMKDEKKVSYNEAMRLKQKGWRARSVSRGGKTLWCVKPPLPTPVCGKSEEQVAPRKVSYLRERGWRVRSVSRGGKTIWCALPPAPRPHCVKEEKEVSYSEAIRLKRKGWSIRRVTRGGKSIWCAKPPGVKPHCRKDEWQVPYRKAQYMRKHGWSVRSVTRSGITIWCAKKPVSKPHCRRGEREVNAKEAIMLQRKGGWSVRKVTKGGKTIWCAQHWYIPNTKPHCNRGEQQVAYRKVPYLRKRGWRVHSVTRNGITIWCARKQQVTIKCPPGTHRVGNHCIKDIIVCPAGMHRVGNRCVRNAIVCPRGTHRVGNRCITDAIIKCPPGTHRVGSRCIKNPIIRREPEIRRCPKGEEWNGKRCIVIPD